MALGNRLVNDSEAYTESKSGFFNTRLKRAGWND